MAQRPTRTKRGGESDISAYFLPEKIKYAHKITMSSVCVCVRAWACVNLKFWANLPISTESGMDVISLAANPSPQILISYNQ